MKAMRPTGDEVSSFGLEPAHFEEAERSANISGYGLGQVLVIQVPGPFELWAPSANVKTCAVVDVGSVGLS